jgi:glycosyltransferase involved in cell wall biosynthesis
MAFREVRTWVATHRGPVDFRHGRPMNAQVNAMSPSSRIEAAPLRVLHLGSPTGLYGAERWILALVGHLPRHGVHSIVSVLKDAPEYKAELCTQAKSLGAETHIFEAYGRFNFSSISSLRRYVREHQIDIIHTHGYKTDIVGLLATAGTNTRIVSTPHGWSVNAGIALRVYEAIDRLSFAFMDAVAPLSDDLQRELVRMPWLRRKLQLIRNGVDLSEVQAAPAACPELEAFKRNGEFVVGYIGQLIPRKGIDCLIRAIAASKSRRIRLCLIGEGPQRAELAERAQQLGIAERVNFYGYRADRLSFLKQFDAFVLPSALEGIPRCVLEAMAANVAVIATDIPGCRDVVHDGRTGLLMPVGDVAALAAALEKLIDDAPSRARMAAAGRTLIESEFSAATMAARYLDLYRKVAAPRAPLANTPG